MLNIQRREEESPGICCKQYYLAGIICFSPLIAMQEGERERESVPQYAVASLYSWEYRMPVAPFCKDND